MQSIIDDWVLNFRIVENYSIVSLRVKIVYDSFDSRFLKWLKVL